MGFFSTSKFRFTPKLKIFNPTIPISLLQAWQQRLDTAALLTAAVATLVLAPSPAAQAQSVTLPSGFSETAIGTDIQNPVGMEVSPDGRVFVLAGNIRRIEVFNDDGYINEFIRLPNALNSGSGLLGLEFAPDFDASGDVYIAYITDPNAIPGPQRFRLSRFSSDGSVADTASETILFEVEDIDPDQQQHQGGDLVIGDDGMIYWALGDRVEGSVVSQPLDSLFGKLLRLNPDGTIPSDNPFYADLEGEFRAIYANGLRNPFRLDKRIMTGDIYMSEVGASVWEELNLAEAGANYGWPLVSGVVNDPAYTDPTFAYPHDPDGCAIIGGTFYEPLVDQFPGEYHDKFFYGDHCFGWIAYHDIDTGTDIRFLSDANRLVEVKVNPVTGSLYYLDRNYAGDTNGRTGGVGRIDYVGGTVPLDITRQPLSVIAAVGENVNFNVLVTGEPPLSFQWFRNEALLDGETASSLTLNSVQSDDNLAEFYVQISDAQGTIVVSDSAILTVSTNNAPTVTINEPGTDVLYIAGEQYTYSASATDVEDGDLGASAFNWEIVFHHDEHTHPFIPEALGVTEGTFTPPVNDETSANVWYRIHLTVTDSTGTSTSVERDIFPLVSNVAIETEPPGLEILLDGTPQSTPIEFEGVAGVNRVFEAPEVQIDNGQTNTFNEWSNGGDRTQTVSTPLFDTDFVATYESQNPGPQVEIGRATVDQDLNVARRWERINFAALTSGIHTIRLTWDNEAADLRFSVFQYLDGDPPNDRLKIGTSSNSATPGEWTGTLSGSEDYYLGVWSAAGVANFVATIEAVSTEPTPLEITTQPANQTIVQGDSVSFTVEAVGTGTLNYQWSLNGVDIDGATDSTFNISAATLADAGTYSVAVNDSNTSDSASATLIVNEAPIAVTIGEGVLDADRVDGPRWMPVNFDPLGGGEHILTVAWDSDADVRFKVREADRTLVPPIGTVRGSNPGVWQGELDANTQYTVGVWSTNGIANIVVTLSIVAGDN